MSDVTPKLIPAGITVNTDAFGNYQCTVTFNSNPQTNSSSISFAPCDGANGITLPQVTVSPSQTYHLTPVNGVYSATLQAAWAGQTLLFTGFGSANPFPVYVTCNNDHFSVSS